MAHPVHTYGTQHTSCEGAFHVVNDLVVVTDNVVPVDNDGHLLTQVEPHEPGLLMLALGQADIPLFAGQALLGDHQPHLQAPGSERGGRRVDTGDTLPRWGRRAGKEVRGHTQEGTLACSPFLGTWVGGCGSGSRAWGLERNAALG